MNKCLVIILIIANCPFFGALASILFGRQGFTGAIRYLFIPDLISAFRGEFWDDMWSEIMLTLWILLCVALVWGEYQYIEVNHPDIFHYLASVWPG